MTPLAIEHAVVTTPQPGADVSGDASLLLPTSYGYLHAVIDGLGHGEKAHAASSAAIAAIESQPESSLAAIFERVNRDIVKTRGVVMSLVRIDTNTREIRWAGVGNVRGVIWQADRSERVHLLTRGGIVGFRLPDLRITTVAVAPGDLLVLATDGLARDWTATAPQGKSAQAVADAVYERYNTGTDDALVSIVRFHE